MYSSLLLPLVLLPAAFAQLNAVAKAHGKKYFGSATDNSELSDSAYVAILSNTSEFGQITPGNTMKWVYTEPSEGTFDYSQGDVISNFAEANGQLLRCHNLVWYNELPSWITSDTWTNATLIAAMQAHITSEVTHYKGQCYCWDVVNEALNDDGTWRTNIFYTTIGPQYVAIAFAAAAAADPSVKLYYNDYNIENPGAKATAAQAIVTSLKSQGVKIDGVGLESHFIVGETPSEATQLANMESFIALGVEVAVTELDVRFTSLPPTTAGYTQQAADYASTVGACVAAGAECVGITVWDFDDKYSWIPSTFSGQGDADLWNADLTKKPAYAAVISALELGTPTSPSSSSSAKPTSTTSATTLKTSTTTITTTTKSISSTTTPTTSKVVTSTTTSASATGSTVPHWGQCGGIGWTGGTVCASPYTCQVGNAYYSQCL